jgi:excisionase family DNA binding protein
MTQESKVPADLSPKEVAQRLGAHAETVRGWLRDGRIRGYRVGDGGVWRVRPAEVERVRRGLRSR